MFRQICAFVLVASCGAAYAVPPTDFMGVTIGQAFNLPECQWRDSRHPSIYDYEFPHDQNVRPCWLYIMASERPGNHLDTNGSFRVGLIPDPLKDPKGVLSMETALIVINGKIAGVVAPTTGVTDQEALFDLLSEKYGKPKTKTLKPVQNMAGATFQKIVATWQKSDATINFEGMTSAVNRGLILVSNPSSDAFIHQEAEKKRAENGSF